MGANTKETAGIAGGFFMPCARAVTIIWTAGSKNGISTAKQ